MLRAMLALAGLYRKTVASYKNDRPTLLSEQNNSCPASDNFVCFVLASFCLFPDFQDFALSL